MLLVILYFLGEIEALLEPPFYILQRFKLQLDESITRNDEAQAAAKAKVGRSNTRMTILLSVVSGCWSCFY